MNRRRSFFLLGLTMLCWSSISFAGTCENIVIPAYFYPFQPRSQWNTSVDNAPLPQGHSQILIMNPNNGPGNAFNQDYANGVSTIHAAGSGYLIFGYVYTNYGQRSLSTVESDIDNYFSWYSVDGIFVDETASDGSLVATYYQPLADYITGKKSGAGVMLNPGVYPDQAYANMTVPPGSLFVINVFEDNYQNYLTATIPSWAYSYPAALFSHLIYSTRAGRMPSAVALSSQRHVGWVYVTDIGLPNPWKELPTYWKRFAAHVRPGC